MDEPILVTCSDPLARCKNLADGEKGRGQGMRSETSGNGYSCECKAGSTFDDATKKCLCPGHGYFGYAVGNESLIEIT